MPIRSLSEARAANKALANKLASSGVTDESSHGFSNEWMERAQRLFSSPTTSPEPVRQPRAAEPLQRQTDPASPEAADRPGADESLQSQLEAALGQLAAARAGEQAARGQLAELENKLAVAEQAKDKWSGYAGKMVQERKDALDACERLRTQLQTAGIEPCQPAAQHGDSESSSAVAASEEAPVGPGSADRAAQHELSELCRLREANQVLMAEQAKLERTLEQLGDEFILMETGKAKAEAEAAAAEGRCAELKSQLEGVSKEPLLSAKDNLKAKYSKTAAMHGKLKEKHERELAEAEQRYAAQLAEAEQHHREEMRAALAAGPPAEALAEFEVQLRALQESEAAQSSELEASRARVEQLTAETARLKEQLGAGSPPGPRLVELRAQLETARSELEAAEVQRQADEVKIFEALEKEAELDGIKDRMAAAEKRHRTQLSQALSDASLANAELEELKQVIDQLQGAESSSKAQANQLSKARLEINKARGEARAARETWEEMAERLKVAEQERDSALDSVKELKRLKGAVDTKLGRAVRSNGQLKQEISQMEAHLSEQVSQLSERQSINTQTTPSPSKKRPVSSPATESAQRELMLKRVFGMFDLDSDGSIDVEELRSIGQQRRKLGHKKGEWTEEKNERLVKRLDTDGDGKVNWQEFVQYYLKLHAARPLPDFMDVTGQYMEVATALYQQRLEQRRPASPDRTELERERGLRREEQAAGLLLRAELDQTTRERSNLEKLVAAQTSRLTEQLESWRRKAESSEQQLAGLAEQIEQGKAQATALAQASAAAQRELQEHRWRACSSKAQEQGELRQQLLESEARATAAEAEIVASRLQLELACEEHKAQIEQAPQACSSSATERTLQRVALKLADELKHTRDQLAKLTQPESAARPEPASLPARPTSLAASAASKREFLESLLGPPPRSLLPTTGSPRSPPIPG